MKAAYCITLAVFWTAIHCQAADSRRDWGFLRQELRRRGVAESALAAIYDDSRMPPFENVFFSIAPRESAEHYRAFSFPRAVTAARECLNVYRPHFEEGQRRYQVDQRILASILFIESSCGRNTGQSMIINRLSRLASIAEPANLEFNLAAHGARRSAELAAKVRARARYLEETFLPEIPALIEVAEREGKNVLDYRGSSAGAFGMPQFLPAAYLKFGVDADGDGRVSLYEPRDAICSLANYLSSYGWRDSAPPDDRRRVIWRYNRSPAYVEAVLGLAAKLAAPPPRPAANPRRPARRAKTG